jgi:hypothetical protein
LGKNIKAQLANMVLLTVASVLIQLTTIHTLTNSLETTTPNLLCPSTLPKPVPVPASRSPRALCTFRWPIVILRFSHPWPYCVSVLLRNECNKTPKLVSSAAARQGRYEDGELPSMGSLGGPLQAHGCLACLVSIAESSGGRRHRTKLPLQ